MSQNRDAPAYQEDAATILAQLPSSVVPRLHATQSPKGRAVVRREVMQSAPKIPWSYLHPAALTVAASSAVASWSTISIFFSLVRF